MPMAWEALKFLHNPGTEVNLLGVPILLAALVLVAYLPSIFKTIKRLFYY